MRNSFLRKEKIVLDELSGKAEMRRIKRRKICSYLLTLIIIISVATNAIAIPILAINNKEMAAELEKSNVDTVKNNITLTEDEYKFLCTLYNETDWVAEYKEYYKKNNPNADEMDIIMASAKAKDTFSYIIEKYSDKPDLEEN